MKLQQRALSILTALVLVSACEITTETHSSFGNSSYDAFTGYYEGSTSALSQGYVTDCKLEMKIKQSSKVLHISFLEFDCDDDTVWELDDSLTFDMRDPSDKTVLAQELYFNGKYVGFINDSNSYAYIGMKRGGNTITLALSQDRNGKQLEKFNIAINDLLLFGAQATNLSEVE